MINRVVLVGRLTKDPEVRKTQNGTSVASYTLAVNRRIQNPGQPDADFISCVAWNKTADLMAQYLHKGSLIGIEGRIQTRSYDNQQGQRVYVTEVITDNVQFLEPRTNTTPQQEQYQTNTPPQQTNGTAPSYGGYTQQYAQPSLTQQIEQDAYANDVLDIDPDDLPF